MLLQYGGSIMNETSFYQWKFIPNYPDYKISTKGEVYSIKKQALKKIGAHNELQLHNENGCAPWSVQVLMGCTFLGNDIDDPFRNRVLFKDKDSSNCNLDNLYIEDTSDLPGEKWRPFSEFNGHKLADYYRVSNKGRVKSI